MAHGVHCNIISDYTQRSLYSKQCTKFKKDLTLHVHAKPSKKYTNCTRLLRCTNQDETELSAMAHTDKTTYQSANIWTCQDREVEIQHTRSTSCSYHTTDENA